MSEREKIVNTMGNLIFGKHASANYNHVSKLAKKLREYDEKHPN